MINYHLERLAPSGCWEYICSFKDMAEAFKVCSYHKRPLGCETVRVVKVTREVLDD